MMTNLEKSEHIMGHGRKAPVDYVDNSEAYLANLPSEPSLSDSIDLANSVLKNGLEYSFHDEDKYGLKMGAYAEYINHTFNGGRR
jgi:hypothetical protein